MLRRIVRSSTTLSLPPLAAFLLCFLFAVTFVPMQQNADGLILSVMALQKPMVYYWSADRFGIATVWLTFWLRNPMTNEYAQLLLEMAAGLAAPVFFCALIFRAPRDAWRAALIADALLLSFASANVLKQVFVATSPYGISLACAGFGLLALERRRLTWLGAALSVIAYVIDFGLVTLALPLIGLLALLFPTPRRARILMWHILGAAVGFVLPKVLVPYFHSDLSLRASGAAIRHYAWVIWQNTRGGYPFAVILPLIALAIYLRIARRRGAALLSPFAAMLGVAVLNFLIIASSRWLAMNAFAIRYVVPALLMLISLGGASLWWLVKFVRFPRNASFTAASALLLVIAFARWYPARADNSDIINAKREPLAKAVATAAVSHDLDGIAASGRSSGYWDVWPAVFLAEQYRYDTGWHGPHIFGIADRGSVMSREFNARLASSGRLRIACVDLNPADCAALITREMRTPILTAEETSTPETAPGGHWIDFVMIYVRK